MKRKVKLADGSEAEGVSVAFRADEPWVEITTEDGARIRLRLIVKDVIRMDDGGMGYVVMSENFVQTFPPPKPERELRLVGTERELRIGPASPMEHPALEPPPGHDHT